MPILFDGRAASGPMAVPAGLGPLSRGRTSGGAKVDCLEIGLLNNMPDSAVRSTERQFIELLTAAADHRPLRLHLFSLPEITRSAAVQAHLVESYSDIADLGRSPLDALIVTGNEPRAPVLSDEPYWQGLTAVIDWAENNTISTLFSCLAAHAAVLHLDGVARQRLPHKRTGVIRCLPASDHPLLAGTPPHLLVPHSRWNNLAEADLLAKGYTILTRTGDGEVDMFAKQWNSLFVFFQGHPEYHVDSLLREYRRDIARWLRGETSVYPDMPENYFSRGSESDLVRFEARALREPREALLPHVPQMLGVRNTVASRWRVSVMPVLRNWLSYVAAQKG